MGIVYEEALKFKAKNPLTIGWRIKKNAAIVESHMAEDEIPVYTFVAQKNDLFFDIFSTAIVCLTNKRILIGRKRVIYGYYLDSISPDMFDDLKVVSGLIWGKIRIDTVKKHMILSHIDTSALSEIESNVSSYMSEIKEMYKATK